MAHRCMGKPTLGLLFTPKKAEKCSSSARKYTYKTHLLSSIRYRASVPTHSSILKCNKNWGSLHVFFCNLRLKKKCLVLQKFCTGQLTHCLKLRPHTSAVLCTQCWWYTNLITILEIFDLWRSEKTKQDFWSHKGYYALRHSIIIDKNVIFIGAI